MRTSQIRNHQPTAPALLDAESIILQRLIGDIVRDTDPAQDQHRHPAQGIRLARGITNETSQLVREHLGDVHRTRSTPPLGITLHPHPELDCGFEVSEYAVEVSYSPWMAEGEDIDQDTFSRLLGHYRDQWEPGSMSSLAYAWYPLDPDALPAPEPRPDLDREFWAQMGRAAYQLTRQTKGER